MIKKALNIPYLPLSDDEISRFKIDLLNWRDLIKNKCLVDAKEMRCGLKKIQDATFLPEIHFLFRIFDVKLLCAEGNLTDAKANLEGISFKGTDVSAEVLYHYYSTYGTYFMFLSKHKEAMDFLQKAVVIMDQLHEQDEALYYNLGVCYTGIDCPNRAVFYLEKGRRLFEEKNNKNFSMFFDIALALNYNKIGECERAKNILTNLLFQAKRVADTAYTGIIYHNLACVYSALGDWKKAFEHFDFAFEYFSRDSVWYVTNLLHEAYALTNSGNYDKATECIDEGLLASNEDSELYLMLKSLECSRRLESVENLEYIENHTIPFLLNNSKLFKAIEYCELLEKYFKKSRNIKKALKYSGLARDSYKKIIRGGEET
jgi:tetratricopeptide (TPR) repeat protein